MSVRDFGADDEDIKSVKFKSFKGKTGETVRVGIVFDDPKKMFKGADIHYKDRYFLCKSNPKTGEKAVCCTHPYKGNKPKTRIGCVMVIYTMSDDNKTLQSWKVVPWIFSETMYQKFRTANREFPLDKHDIMLSCTNEDFQTIDVQPCKQSLWQSKEEFKLKVLEAARSYTGEIADNLGGDLTITEIRELLGTDTPGIGDAAEDVDLDSIVDGID